VNLEGLQRLIADTASLSDQEYWPQIRVLAELLPREDPAFSAYVEALLREPISSHTLGRHIDLLGQVADRHPTVKKAIAARLALVEYGDRADAAWSLAHALGILIAREAGPALLRLSSFPRSDIRYQALRGISELLEEKLLAEELAVPVLIRLADDEDEDNRDWATFALASFTHSSSEEVLDVLWRRLTDDNPEVRGEALVGLARRGVTDIVPIIEEELEYDDVGTLQVEAALELGDPALNGVLIELSRRGWDKKPQLLAEAIRRTSP
jgi:HEAT repeat protein